MLTFRKSHQARFQVHCAKELHLCRCQTLKPIRQHPRRYDQLGRQLRMMPSPTHLPPQILHVHQEARRRTPHLPLHTQRLTPIMTATNMHQLVRQRAAPLNLKQPRIQKDQVNTVRLARTLLELAHLNPDTRIRFHYLPWIKQSSSSFVAPNLRTPRVAAVTPKGDPGHNQVLGGVLILLLNRVEMITQRLPPIRGAIRREVEAALQ